MGIFNELLSSKMSYFLHFSSIYVPLEFTCLVTLFDRKLQVFKKSPKLTIFGIFSELLATQNVNVARFARNVEWDFFCDFQTPWVTYKSRKLSSSRTFDNISFHEKIFTTFGWFEINFSLATSYSFFGRKNSNILSCD